MNRFALIILASASIVGCQQGPQRYDCTQWVTEYRDSKSCGDFGCVDVQQPYKICTNRVEREEYKVWAKAKKEAEANQL